MATSLLASILLLQAVASINCISVVSPQSFRPYSTLRLAVTSDSQTVSLYVGIEGRQNNGNVFTEGQELYLLPASSKIVELKINDPGPGTYDVVVRSTTANEFSRTSPIVYVPKSYCVLVQTDKRIYNPKDVISFKVIALDKYLLPVKNAVDVSILDTGGSPVKQWQSVLLDRGIFSSELTLADQPALGEWTIKVETQNQTYEEKVQVADYVLPKFQLDIEVPKHALFKDGSFTANVTARYFNGLPVKGELTLAVYPVFFSDIVQPVFSSPVRKVIFIDGFASIEVSIKKDLNIAEDAARPIVVEAILEEQYTLRRQNASARLLLLRTPYRMLVHSPTFFKPELPYTIQIEIVDQDGKLYEEGDDTVQVERVWDDGAPPNVTTITLDEDSRAIYTYTPDRAHNRSTLNIVITYMDIKERLVNVKPSYTSIGEYINAEVEEGGVNSDGDELKIRVRCTKKVSLINYALIGRGDMIDVVSQELVPERDVVDLRLPTIPEMAPGVIFLVWYPSVSGEIIASSLYIPVLGLFRNKVGLLVNPQQSRPGSTVEITMVAAAGSHSGILASDSRNVANKIASENGLGAGIDYMTVERQVESFSGISHSVYKETEKLPTLGIEVGESNVAETFQKSGMIILTDGFVSSDNPGGSPPVLIVSGPRPPPAGPYAFTRLPPAPSPRIYLSSKTSASWIVANITQGVDDRGVVSRKSPQEPSTWTVGAFAVHPTLGLGIAEPSTYQTSVPVYLEADIPESIQLGEAVTVVVTVTSSLSSPVDVQIIFHNSEKSFSFEPLDNDVNTGKETDALKRETLRLDPGKKQSTAFLITAAKTGVAQVMIEATGAGISTSYFGTINVQNGFSSTLAKWSLLDSRSGQANATVVLRGPRVYSPVNGLILATGDVLAPALASISSPTEPASDAEQAIKPLIRGCLVLDYLETSQEVGLIAESKALTESGLQRLMAYRTKTGAFSVDSGSQIPDVLMTIISGGWLTRCARWLPISPEAGSMALSWLSTVQDNNGSWKTTSKIAPHLQNSAALTSLATIAFINSQSATVLYSNTIKKATNFLLESLQNTDDALTLAVITRALTSTQHIDKDNALSKLQTKSNFTNGVRWWPRAVSESEKRSPWLNGSNIEVETSSHALLAVLGSGLIEESVPIARWLVANGAPDHPVKMEALAAFGNILKVGNRLHIEAKLPEEDTRQFNIDDSKSLILQSQPLKNVRNVTAESEGKGMALIGLLSEISSSATSPWPRYTLDPRVDTVSTPARLQLSVCFGFVALPNDKDSGLTLMEIKLPSGFTADLDAITALHAVRHIAGARLLDSGSRIAVWVKPSPAGEQCATLWAARTQRVARQKPGWVTMVDLYDDSHRARVFFSPVQSTLCDICPDLPSCSKACGSASRQTSQNGRPNQNGGASSNGANNDAKINGATTAPSSSNRLIYSIFTLIISFICFH